MGSPCKNIIDGGRKGGWGRGCTRRFIIPIQVPAIETCFMPIDEIARIFSKSQSLYRGGEIGIFLKSQVLGRALVRPTHNSLHKSLAPASPVISRILWERHTSNSLPSPLCRRFQQPIFCSTDGSKHNNEIRRLSLFCSNFIDQSKYEDHVS